MEKNSKLIIEQVGNGYIISEYENPCSITVRINSDRLVAQSMKELIHLIIDHFDFVQTEQLLIDVNGT